MFRDKTSTVRRCLVASDEQVVLEVESVDFVEGHRVLAGRRQQSAIRGGSWADHILLSGGANSGWACKL